MPGKRKDSNGRVLKTGESQRKDMTYMFRYTDANHKKQCIYAPTLEALREKEYKISIELARGVASTNAKMTVADLLQIVLQLKGNVRYKTQRGYESHIRMLSKEEFAKRRISSIKTSDAKMFILKMQNDGYGFWTIDARFTLLKQAFNVAVEDDVIFKNPFNWKLSNVINIKKTERSALTKEEQDDFLQFVSNSGCYSKYLYEILVLLGTGVRISEFCGLTTDNIDFSNRRIHIEKQLAVLEGRTLIFTATKSSAGDRFIPMSDSVYAALTRIMKKRESLTMPFKVDGRDDILFLRKDGTPRIPSCYQSHLQNITNAFNKETGQSIKVTPHILRHTFCTNMMRAGVDVKAMQYLMGHTSADITLNVYTHATYKDAETSFIDKCSAM